MCFNGSMTDSPTNTRPINQTLHDHYARNAQANGHSADCEKITRPINWPTICGRPTCTCEAAK